MNFKNMKNKLKYINSCYMFVSIPIVVLQKQIEIRVVVSETLYVRTLHI